MDFFLNKETFHRGGRSKNGTAQYGVIMHINSHEDCVVPPQYNTLCSDITSEEKWPKL